MTKLKEAVINESGVGARQHKVRVDGYGDNGYDGPSSLPPGQKISADFNTKPPGGDAVLDGLIDGGGDDATDWQTRKLPDSNVPVAYGQKGASAGGKIPGSLVDDEAPLPTVPGK